MPTRTVKVWNKTVIISNAPDTYNDKELIEMAKKKLVYDAIQKSNIMGGMAS